MKARIVAIIIMSCFGLAAASCSTKKSSPPSSKKSGGSDDECEADATAKKKKASLALLATTYDDIKGIIEDECKSCHKAGGLGNLDLTTYKAMKSSADAVVEAIETDDEDLLMPPGAKLSDSNIKKIKAWVTDGKLEDDSASAEEEEEESTSTKTSKSSKDDPCDTKKKTDSDDSGLETEGDTESGDDDDGDESGDETPKEEPFKIDPELYKMFIEPEEMKACHTQGKTYLRAGTKEPLDPTPRCDTVNYPAKFECNEAGVLAAFNNAQVVKDEITARKAEGYIFDQCGEAAGKPVVYLVCFQADDGKCVAPENLKSDGLTIKASSIGRP
jgi:hypothetical protein